VHLSANDGVRITFAVALGAHHEVCEAQEAACDGEETWGGGTHRRWCGFRVGLERSEMVVDGVMIGVTRLLTSSAGS
jgi:hypothetical protein